MGKYAMVAYSKALPGREAEFNHWYDTVHYPEICAIPGVISGRRFDSTPVGMGPDFAPYLAIYEIEVENPSDILVEMGKRQAAGQMTMTDSIDQSVTALRFYAQHEMAGA